MDVGAPQTTPPIKTSPQQVESNESSNESPLSPAQESWKRYGEFKQKERELAAPSEHEKQIEETADDTVPPDPWDVDPNAVKQPAEDDGDPMKPYRSAKGYALESPTNGPELSTTALEDFGRIAARLGFSAEAAESFVKMFAGATSERDLVDNDGNYDDLRTVSQLRHDWGEATEENLAAIERLCTARPELAAFLESSRLGSSPAVLRLLAGAAKHPEVMKPATAQRFIDKVLKDPKHSYWSGDKVAMAALQVAYVVVGDRK